MSRKSVTTLVVAVLIAAPSCARSVHTRPESVPTAFAAPFTARVSSDRGSMRFGGVLAAAEGGRLRVEVARGGESFLFVAGGGETSAVLSRGSVFMREGAGSTLLRELTGVGLDAAQISSALRGVASGLPPGCASRSGRWRSAGETGRVPTRVKVRCGGEELAIRLGRPDTLSEGRAGTAFATLEAPPGYRRVTASELAGELRDALGAR